MQIEFILVNESTLTDAQFGGELTAPILDQIAHALDAYATEDLSPEYGGGYLVRAGALADAVGFNRCAVRIVDSLANVPGAAAYHDRLPSGASIIWAARNEFDSFADGSSPLSEGIGHEIAETIGDAPATAWNDRPDGTEEARELCDRLQGSRYAKSGIIVPDFLLLTAWAAGAPRPYSKLDALTGQFDMTPGGYVILRSQGAEIQPSSEKNEHRLVLAKSVRAHGAGVEKLLKPVTPYERARLERKQHPISRSHARGARFQLAA